MKSRIEYSVSLFGRVIVVLTLSLVFSVLNFSANTNAQEFIEAKVGTVAATGKLIQQSDGTEACMFTETSIGSSNSAEITSAAISMRITPDCQLIVESVNKEYDTVSNSMLADHRIGVWAEHRDTVGIPLTEAYADMHYSDNGSTVYGGYSPYTYCHNALDGWYGVSSSWNWNPSGSGSVWIWKLCTFEYIGGSWNHTLDATVYGWPGGAWQNYCNIWGALVPGGYLTCGGDQW